VPKQAVLTKDGKSVVFVVDADSTAHQHEVSVGAEQAGQTEILKGISAGDHVIRLGQYELADGAKVKAPEAADKEKAGADDRKDAGDKADAADKKGAGDKPDKGDKDTAKSKTGGEKP